MKLKSKIFGAIGIGTITVTSLAAVVGCTYSHKPQGEYTAPQVTQEGVSFMTRKGDPKCEIAGFKLSRNLYSGEKVTAHAEIKPSESTEGISIKSILCGYVSSNELKLNIELNGTEGKETVAAKVVFNVSFIFTYGKEEQSYVLPKDLTINYTPDFAVNTVTIDSGRPMPEIKPVNRGDNSFVILAAVSPFKLSLAEGLRNHERVYVESNNPYIKASVGMMQVGDSYIPLTLTVDDESEVAYHEYEFSLSFTITMDSVSEGESQRYGTYRFKYSPYWRDINVTFQGKTLMIAPTTRGGDSASMTQNFLLSRKLYKEETNEHVHINVIDPKTKEELGPTGRSVFEYSTEETGGRYYTLNLRYLGSKENTAYIPFRVTFTFYDDIGKSTPLEKITLPFESDDETEGEKTVFNFVYTPAWNENYAEWTGGSSEADRTITTAVGNPSADFGTSTSKLIKLHRNLVEGVETLNVSLSSEQNLLTLGSWEIVANNDEYYLWLKNITNTDPVKHQEIPFTISIAFLEDGNIMHTDGVDKLGSFKFIYSQPEPEPHAEILIPNAQTEPGKTRLSITAPLTKPIESGATLTAAPSSTWTDRIEIENQVLSDDRMSMTFDILLKAITDEVLYTADIKYSDVVFAMKLSKDGTDTDFDSNYFNITFIKGENPWKEDEETYMDDRTFSFVCYEDKGTSTIPYTQSAFILSKDMKTNKPYQYYVATTWTYKRQYESVANSARVSNNDFVVGVTDSSLHRTHKYSTTKNTEPTLEMKGSKWDENYLNFEAPSDNIKWENENNFKNKHTTRAAWASLFYSTHTGAANIFVAKVDFQSIVDQNQGGWIQQKLDLLNAWQKNKTDNPEGRINNFVDKAVLQTDSDANFNNFYVAGYPTYNYYFSKSATKTEPIVAFDEDMYYNDEAAIPGAQPSRNRQTFYPYYYQTAQRSWNHSSEAIEDSCKFLTDMDHVCPSYHTMTGDAVAGSPYWFGQPLASIGYLSPGSMMIARNRNGVGGKHKNEVFLLGMYVGYKSLIGSYKATSDYDLPGAYYMPWFDSYVNHEDEKWSNVEDDTLIDIFKVYREDEQLKP